MQLVRPRTKKSMNKEHNTDSIIAIIAAIREQANAFLLSSLSEKGIDDLLPAHGAVLNALFQKNPMSMSELAERIGRKKNTVTGLINTLEDRGYCRREQDPGDARAQQILLTNKGEGMRQVQRNVSDELLCKVWGNMEEQEKTACVHSLKTILHNLEQS